MARAESLAKGGFYAFPETSLPDVLRLFAPAPAGTRLLDPCAGEGDALNALAIGLNLSPYAIELEYARAETCAKRFPSGQALRADMFNVELPAGSMQVAFVNPPFTWDTAVPGKRREAGMLEHSWQWLQMNGWMVFVSYAHHLTPSLIHHVAGQASSIEVFRLQAKHFDVYTYTVLVAQKGKAANPVALAQGVIKSLDQIESLPLLSSAEPTRRIPAPTPVKEMYFHRSWISPDDILSAIEAAGADQTTTWRVALQPPPEDTVIRPPLRPKIGHMVTLVAGGMFNYLHMETSRGRAMLRSVIRYVEELTETQTNDDGKNKKEVYTLRPRTTITLLHEDGLLEDISTDAALNTFIQTYKQQLFAYADKRFTPRYNMTGDTPEKRKWLPHMQRQRVKGKFRLFPAQMHVAAAICTTLEQIHRCLFIGEMSTGKAQPLDAKILTPSGWKHMGDMQVGDAIINSQGGISHIIGVFPQGEKEIYRVTFNDGSSTECCDDHLWQVNTFLRDSRGNLPMVKALSEIRHHLRDGANNRIYRIPLVKPVDFSPIQLPLDPYLLGILLGDGNLSGKYTVGFSSADEEIITAVKSLLPSTVTLKYGGKYDWRITLGKKGRFNPIVIAIREMGLAGKLSEAKFIPPIYKMASADQRLALLQGLMDTDGYGNISPEFTSVSKQLADDVRELVWSLGGYASVTDKIPSFTYKSEKKSGQRCYTVHIHLPPEIDVFRLERKRAAHQQRSNLKKYPIRSIERVEYVGIKQAQCIKVDSPDSLYVTDDYVLTHNTATSIAIMDAWHREGKIKPGQVMWVNCPSHLVKKWAREVQQQLPEARVTKLVLEDERGRHDMLADLGNAMRAAAQEPSRLHVLIAAQDAIKLGEGWEPAYQKDIKKRLICPVTGARMQQSLEGYLIDLDADDLKGKQFFSPDGRHAYWQEVRKFGLQKGKKAAIKNPRGPVWRLFKKRYKGRIAISFFDEVQGSKDIATDRYRSMSVIARASDNMVALTGTIFNGYASSLYGLETVFNPTLFERYPWGNAGISQFVRDMGVLEKVVEYRDEYNKNGTYSGVKRVNHGARERPGASPLLIQMLLDHAVFLSLSDIGKALPKLTEAPVAIDMAQRQADAYKTGMEIVKSHLLDCQHSGDASFLAAYFRTSLAYPDTATDLLEVVHRMITRARNGSIISEVPVKVHTFPALDLAQLPKEAWLVDLVKQEMAEGRGVAVFVTQTDKRDYQPRLAKLLRDHAGANPVILYSDTVKPIDREEWIEKEFASGRNALICNPRLVETGLDLIMCPTLIFFEPEYQLSVLAQAARRHWRIPQTKDCRTYYVYYRETMQEKAMKLITDKLQSLSVVNGESASLSALNQVGDILKELMKGDVVVNDLRSEFAAINQREHNDAEWEEALLPEVVALPAHIQPHLLPVRERTIQIDDAPARTKQLAMF